MRRLANDLKLIIAAFAPHRCELQGVVIESTRNWYWLVDGLIAADFNACFSGKGCRLPVSMCSAMTCWRPIRSDAGYCNWRTV
jgi:hypothetical protein